MNGKLVPILIGALLAINSLILGHLATTVSAQNTKVDSLNDTVIELKTEVRFIKEKLYGIPK